MALIQTLISEIKLYNSTGGFDEIFKVNPFKELNDSNLSFHEKRQRFFTMVEVHQRAFTVRPDESLKPLVCEIIQDYPWMAQGDADQLTKSLSAIQNRTCDDWEWIFVLPTDLVSEFNKGLHGSTYHDYVKLVGIHLSEEASEVIKEVCKDQRNDRYMGKNTLKELADMQAMINLSLETMSQSQMDEFHLQTRLMANKKRVVIHQEVMEKNQ